MNTSGSHNIHSHIGASASERFLECPGSVQLAAHCENESKDYTRLGTAAHDVAAWCLETGSDPMFFPGGKVLHAGEEFPVDEDMAAAVGEYMDYVLSRMELYHDLEGEFPTLFVEQGFDLDHVWAGMYGTSDCVLWFPKWGLLEVIDYKHGEGIPVQVVQNPQLQYYACGAIHRLGAATASSEVEQVKLTICQPRCAHPSGYTRSWDTTVEDLMEFLTNVLVPGIKEALTPGAPLKDGPHCRFCPARLVCPMLTERFETFKHAADMDADPTVVSDLQLGEMYEATETVRIFMKAVEGETYKRLTRGLDIPGAKLVNQKAQRAWKEGAVGAAKAAGLECYQAPAFNSPAQMEKVPGGREFARKWAYKPEAGLTVARAHDIRDKVSARRAVEVFANVPASDT
ncbi:DUF2800 domain-containing protein [uncultured Rhodospira sp.]|uniref:DUF2800 domain-containing protein n=1 Tax=uncultured Rhodospira sp. TaxID=1936189 RepID=UPI00260B0738|nr:DUF2800 domain-containing protein [uncultured Rhodospira sp.]